MGAMQTVKDINVFLPNQYAKNYGAKLVAIIGFSIFLLLIIG